MIELVDTHCHIHFPDYGLEPEEVIAVAQKVGVTRLLCVGCTLGDSELAIAMAAKRDHIWASIGLHPHEAKQYVCDAPTCLPAQQSAPSSLLAQRGVDNSGTLSPYHLYGSVHSSSSPSAASKHKHTVLLERFTKLAKNPKVVAVGETGLDYYYEHSAKEHQKELFRFQLTLAQEQGLPLIFHVRGSAEDEQKAAFDDFLAILDDFEDVEGVVHSFTADTRTLDKLLARGLYIGLNGIMTFTKDQKQLEMAKKVPLHRLLLETDAPFLTPVPERGTICQPKHVGITARFLSDLRGETLEELAAATTQNARQLFNLK